MAQNHKVVIYKTATCIWCHKTMDFLKANKIKFTEKDVGEDEKALEEMMKKSGQRGVPVILIDNKQVIVGFDESALRKTLGIK